MSSGKYVSARCTIDNPSQFVLIILGGGVSITVLVLIVGGDVTAVVEADTPTSPCFRHPFLFVF